MNSNPKFIHAKAFGARELLNPISSMKVIKKTFYDQI